MLFLYNRLDIFQCQQINAQIVTAAETSRGWDQQAQPAPATVSGAPEKPFPILRRMLILNLIAATFAYGFSFLSALSGRGFPMAEWNILLLHICTIALLFWIDPRTNLALRQLLQPVLASRLTG